MSPPLDVVATAGNASVMVTWAPPDVGGPSAITGYLVTAKPLGVIAPVVDALVAVSPATLTGLVNGRRYAVSVASQTKSGASVATTARAVTPRLPVHVRVSSRLVRSVRYGTATRVFAILVAHTGGVSNEMLGLYARAPGIGGWHRIAAARTDAHGRAVLTAGLRRTSTLLVNHPAGVASGTYSVLGTVHVAKRVAAHVVRQVTHVGDTVGVAGTVAPAQRPHRAVTLQRRVDGRWLTVARGVMTTRHRFHVAWRPATAAHAVLRVLRPASGGLAHGVSGAFHVRVAPVTAAWLARRILHMRSITLDDTHESGVRDRGAPKDEIEQVARGGSAQRSCYGNAPCGTTRLSLGMLEGLIALGRVARVEVSEIAGGSHAPNSSHYKGLAMDIDSVNGVAVSSGSGYETVVRSCRDSGATTIYDPGYDPYGGHSNHVHCEWP